MMLQRSTLLWVFMASAALVTVCFASSLKNDFIVDDYRVVALNPVIRTVAPLQFLKTPYWGANSHAGLYRPLTIFSFSLEYPLWKRWPGGYRLTNLLLHSINGALVFIVARGILASTPAAWAAAAIYIVHPVHTEPVVGIAGRSELLATTFFLLAWIFFRQKRTALCVFAFMLSLLSKENAITFPAVVALEMLVFDGGFKAILRDWRRFGVLGACGAVYLGLRLGVLGGLGLPKGVQYIEGAWTVAQRELTTGRSFLKYFELLLAPIRVTGDYDFNTIPLANAGDWIAWAGLLLVVVSILLALRLLKTQPAVAFGILFFYVTIFTVSNWVMPTGVLVSERALYLPSLGVCLLAGSLWARMSTPQLRRIIGAGVLVSSALLCISHSYVWRNDLTYFGNLVRVYPDNVRGQLGYGIALIEAGRPEEGRVHFEAGLQLTRSAPLLVGLGQALVQIDHGCARALPVLMEALSIRPVDPFAPWLLGECYERAGSLAQAEAAYRQAVSNTDFPEPRLLIAWGRILERTGRSAEAQEAYRRATLVQ
jgi:hypothetical protein